MPAKKKEEVIKTETEYGERIQQLKDKAIHGLAEIREATWNIIRSLPNKNLEKKAGAVDNAIKTLLKEIITL